MQKENKRRKLLLIKLRDIGDTLSLLPVIETLHANSTKLETDVLVHKGTEDLLSLHPGINKLWIYDRKLAKRNIFKSLYYHKCLIQNLRNQKYDIIIDYTHGDRASFLSFLIGAPLRVTYRESSSLSRILMNQIIEMNSQKNHIVDYQLEALKILGIENFVKRIRIYLPESLDAQVEQMLPDACGRRRIVIHPGAQRILRQWQPSRFGTVARRLHDQFGAQIILIGGNNEKNLVDEVERFMGFSAAFKSNGLTLLEMAGILKHSNLLIGNDSGPGHIAAGVDCPSLILFGPQFPHKWRPYSSKNEVIFKNVPCCGCRQIACIRPEQNCMDLIEVDEVWEKTQSLLKAF
jgi:predicted lipopolysaccharide heptosyltransferase III